MPSRLRHVLLLLPLGLTACFGPLLDDYDHEQDWDQDGVKVDADCNDEDPQVTQATYWPDGDRDGYGADGVVVYGCAPPDGYADNDDDCDDADVLAWREAAWFEDLDLDGFGVGESEIRCAGHGTSEVDGDCDDSRGDVYPGAEPVCGNGVDDDCDGLGDCGGPSEDDDGEPWDGKYSGSDMSEMGASVAGAGDVNGDGYADLLIGTPGVEDSEGDEVGGAVLIYGPAPSSYALGEPLSGVARLTGTVADGRAGEVVSSAGDLNGDGYADLLIGAPEAGASADGGWGGFGGGGLPMAFGPGDGGGIPGDVGGGIFDDEGAGYVYVVLGPVVGQEARLGENINTGVLKGSDGGARSGAALASLGDVTDDGFDDLLVGAPMAPNGELDEAGAVWLVPGPFTEDTSLTSAALWTLTGPHEADRFGTSVASVGDMDGDGQQDFAVGAPTDIWPTSSEIPRSADGTGDVYIYLNLLDGSDNADITDLVLTGVSDASFGAEVTGVGDLDGDGAPDLAVGAPTAEGAGVDSGAVYIYSGAGIMQAEADGSDPAEALIALIEGGPEGAWLGTALRGPGDLDGDLIDDLLIGAPEVDEGHGMVAIFYSPPPATATLNEADYALSGDYAGTRLGHAVAGADDANGLGRADVIFSSLELGSDEDAYGTGYVYFLPSDGL